MNRFDRNIRFFGKDGQEKLRQNHICIVGCGGLGQHVIQQAAFAGFGEITLIDDEELSPSNLNRYVLAWNDDPIPGTHKVDIARRAIALIDPDIKVNPIYGPLRSAEAFSALKSSNIMVGCLDNDGARLVLTEFALAYQKAYFDLASDISAEDGLRYGGRILFTGAGNGCPVCLGEIDLAQARIDLESEASRQDREKLYGVPLALLDEGGPSVVSINGAVASLAVTEIIAYITGIRQPKRFINYRGHMAQATCNTDSPSGSCYFCDTVKGKGGAAGVERYIHTASSGSKTPQNKEDQVLTKTTPMSAWKLATYVASLAFAGAILFFLSAGLVEPFKKLIRAFNDPSIGKSAADWARFIFWSLFYGSIWSSAYLWFKGSEKKFLDTWFSK